MREFATPFISTDLLWSVLEVDKTEWREHMPKGVDRIPKAGLMFRPYLEAAATALIELFPNATIEGEVISPEDVVGLRARHDVRSVFLVRGRVAATDLQFAGATDSWLVGKPADLVDVVVEEVRKYSRVLAQECGRVGLPTVDVSNDFDKAMTDALTLLRHS